MLSLTKGEHGAAGVALALRFLGRNPRARVRRARERRRATVNYLRGSDSAGWQTRLARYGEIVYRDLWPGIDLRLHEQAGVLKYEFHVRPGARPSDIRLAYAGADGLALDADRRAADRDRPGRRCATRRRSPTRTIDGVARAGRRAATGSSDGADEARASRSPSAATSATTSWSSTPACSTRPSSAAAARDRRRHRRRRRRQRLRRRHDAVARTSRRRRAPSDAPARRSNFADVFVTKLNPAGTALVYSTFVGGSDMEFGSGSPSTRPATPTSPADEVVELPDHRRRLRPQPQHPAELPALRHRQHRRLRLQAQRRRLGARLLHVPRRHRHTTRRAASRWTAPATPTSPARRCRATSRPPPARSTRTRARRVRHVRHEAEPDRLGARVLDLPRRHAGRQRRARRGRRRRQRLRHGLHRARPTSRPRRAPSTGRRTAAST